MKGILDDIWMIHDPHKSRAFRASFTSGGHPISLLCGDTKPQLPVVVERDEGTKIYDVIWTGWLVPLVGPRFISVLRDNDVSGWDEYPVEIVDQRGEESDGFSGLVVRGRCGPLRDDLSEVVEVVYPSGVRSTEYKGWLFDPETWDGSDVFVPTPCGPIFYVTSRVRDLLVREKITNIELEKATESTRPITPATRAE